MENNYYIELLMEIKQSLGQLHSKLDGQSDSLDEHKEEDERSHSGFSARLVSLEETRTKVVGSWAVLIIAVAVVSSLVTMLAHALVLGK